VIEAHNLFCEGLASGEVKPLPFRLFGVDHVENAFRFLSTGVPALLLCQGSRTLNDVGDST
jgi:hypothetical protein